MNIANAGLQWKRLNDRLRYQVAKRDNDADIESRAQRRRIAAQRPTVLRNAGGLDVLAHRIRGALAGGDGGQFGHRIEGIVVPGRRINWSHILLVVLRREVWVHRN